MTEIVSAFVGYSYYVNVPKTPHPRVDHRDYVVTADRLWMKAVLDLVKAYKTTMQRGPSIPRADHLLRPRDAELRQLFAESWDRYTAGQKGGSAAKNSGYKAYPLSSDERRRREEIASVAVVVSKLQNLGLTDLEASIPEEKLLEGLPARPRPRTCGKSCVRLLRRASSLPKCSPRSRCAGRRSFRSFAERSSELLKGFAALTKPRRAEAGFYRQR